MSGETDLRAWLLRGHSSDIRTLDSRDLAAMRPQVSPRRARRVPRPAPPALPPASEIVGGVVCFCGERFAETQALEFMRHLRAEVQADMEVLARFRETRRKSEAAPKRRAAKAQQQRVKYATSEEYRERRRMAARERMRRKRAEGWKAARTDRDREREQARRIAAGKPCKCGCGQVTRDGRDWKPGHHQRGEAADA